MAANPSNLITGYVRMWPRALFDMHKANRLIFNLPEFKEKFRLFWGPGVYVLYRDEHPYYVGQASKQLFKRLHAHANQSSDRYFSFWDSFSAFAVPKKHLDEVEAVLIATVPTANSANPRLNPDRLPKEIVRILTARRRIDAEHPRLATQPEPRDFLTRTRSPRMSKARS